YKPLVRYLLKGVYIVEKIAECEDTLRENKQAIFIEKSGKKHRGYARMGGGSAGLFEGNKLGRYKILEKLQKEIRQVEKIAQKIQEQIKNKKEELQDVKTHLEEKKLEL